MVHCARLPLRASRTFPAAPSNVPGLQAAAQQPHRTPWRLQRLTGSRRAVPQHVCCCQAAEQSLPDDNSAAPARQQQQEEEELQDSDSMAQYEQLKADMNRTTRRFAAFLGGYLLLTTTSDVAVCAGLGSVAGYGYLQLLMRDVDTLRQDDPIAEAFLMAEDSRLEFAALRSARKLVAAMRAALRPRLLVLVGLAAAAAAYNSAAPEPLNGVQTAALFTGFLTYKAGQLGQVWDALRPKFDPEVLTKPPTPVLTTFEEREAAAEAEVELFRQKMRRR